MKVLITGASGRLGTYVVRELAGRHDLVLTSRREPPRELAEFPWIRSDLTRFEDCQRAVAGVDAIQHLGAQPWPTDHPETAAKAAEERLPFDATFRTNMMGLYYLMQAAVQAGVKTVVFCGSNCSLGHGFRISKTPFPIQVLPIDEKHPCFPEDSYSYTKRAGEDLLASYTRAYGIRTYGTRPAGICPPERRQAMARNARPASGWSPWLWNWVGSEDVARAHRLLMEEAENLPPHDVFFLNADDTVALEPSRELVERFQPSLAHLASRLEGHQSLISNVKLQRAVGWRHQTSWRTQP
jgi:nucleoside-diphosphate-sugar epimerase